VQLAFLGASSSPSFVAALEGKGVAERFIRTPKEQILWGEHFTGLERHGDKPRDRVRPALTPPSQLAA
jgi:hypothetical protein